MVAIDFPDAPTNGQVFDKWTWDGTKWVLTVSPTLAALIPPLSTGVLLIPSGAFASQGVTITNTKAGTTGIVHGLIAISSSAVNSTFQAWPIYTKPSAPGTWIQMGGPVTLNYIPVVIGQLTMPVVGMVTLTEVGAHQFALWAVSSTNTTAVMAGYSGGVAMIVGA